ncbi:conserved hypothetical protein [Beutenbergia cavernae DSM 12333]|uniref:PEP phosphonomutase n=1 Tax=Beutenbergia cavernae (strain ATCC BAA-8 / DSM 12333 / CCUG 43141 / JCM 11478 / NBRC 16432 / NCIMB 13614 / HKI 0122) TaxID=471853 RepID=C5C673_BEUC1|nr:isocitrate lyase/phosphoenolpyruvate mutase family protein [Beutenbergia cavernae]ACQ80279.1 conserved hypothetical protein [Beutenbergia cavernae DSM 12333]
MSPGEFRRRHRPGAPLLLPNAWDLASARWLVGAGFDVVGTTSLGVAFAAGKPDGSGAIAEETSALASTLTRAGIAVTVDIEAGFSDDPDDVGRYASRLAALGVVGLNLEDSDGRGGLVDVDLAVAKVAAVAHAAPEVFLNARTDPFWLARGDPAADLAAAEGTALERGVAYVAAGASGVFVPGALPPATMRTLAAQLPAPLNVLVQERLGVAELARSGVARVSTGSLLFRSALAAVRDGAAALRGVPPAGVPSYDDVAGAGATDRGMGDVEESG